MLTASLEDYLEAILSIYEEQDCVKAIEISKRLYTIIFNREYNKLQSEELNFFLQKKILIQRYGNLVVVASLVCKRNHV